MPYRYVRRAPEARVAVLSFYAEYPNVDRASALELADVIRAVDRADVLDVIGASTFRRRVRGLARRLRLGAALDGLQPCPLERNYELLFVHVQNPRDLQLLGCLDAWRRRCGAMVCLIDEVWARDVPRISAGMDLLSRFERVFLVFEGSVAAVGAACGRPTATLPGAVDALRFCPDPELPERPIEVYNMGRRAPATHRALLRRAAARGSFYLFSSTIGRRAPDGREHRQLLAETLKRSRYTLAYRGKIDAPEATGQEEVGLRFFEGSAAGAVLLGEAPRSPGFARYFPYPDAVVPLPYGSEAVDAVIDRLEADPERLDALRRRHVVNALRRHDWLHRWEAVLDSVGLDPLPGAEARRDQLEARAAAVEGARALA